MATARVPRSTAVRPARDDREQPRRRHLEAVRSATARRTIPLTPRTGVVLTLALFGGLFGVAVSHALLIEGQSELDRLDEQVAGEQSRYERLRLEVAELESPERIVNEARELGMVPPEETVWLTPEAEAGGGAAADTESSDTSWEDVKQYMEPTP